MFFWGVQSSVFLGGTDQPPRPPGPATLLAVSIAQPEGPVALHGRVIAKLALLAAMPLWSVGAVAGVRERGTRLLAAMPLWSVGAVVAVGNAELALLAVVG